MEFTLQDFNIQVNVKRIANLQYFEFTNHYSTKSDSHNFYELLYIDRGNIFITADNYIGNLSVNQIIIHQPNEKHSLTTSDTLAPSIIIIGFECDSDALECFSEKPITLNSEQINSLAKILQEGMSIFKPPYDMLNQSYMPKRDTYPFGADQMIKIGLEAFLINLIRGQKKDASPQKSYNGANGVIEAVHKYITENFCSKLSLDNLCFLFGLNKTTLCMNFKNTYGKTIFNFISDLKIKEAKAILRSKKLSITEISELLGFESVHYFCRTFKKNTGVSPTEYAGMIRSKLNMQD